MWTIPQWNKKIKKFPYSKNPYVRDKTTRKKMVVPPANLTIPEMRE